MTEHTYTEADLHALDDAAFNRVIAQMAGWRIEQEMVGGNTLKIIVPPATAQDAIRPFRLARDLEDAIPDYASDLNAAWALFGGSGERVTWEAGFAPSRGCMGRIITLNESYTDAKTCVVWHANPARALATAWALWKQERTP